MEEPPKITLQDNEQSQQGNNETHTLKNQLRVSEDMVVASLVHYDSTHELVEELYRKVPREVEGDWHVADLQKVKTALKTMKSDYLFLLSNRDYILKIVEIYAEQSNRGKDEIEELNGSLSMFVRHWMKLNFLFKKQKIRSRSRITLGNMWMK